MCPKANVATYYHNLVEVGNSVFNVDNCSLINCSTVLFLHLKIYRH